MSRTVDGLGPDQIEARTSRRYSAAARWAAIGGGVLALGAGAALWVSEGARVFADAAFAAMLACL